MTCPWKEIAVLEDGRKAIECENCGATLSVPATTVLSRIVGCRSSSREPVAPTIQQIGPGTELARILAGLRAAKTEGCGCDEMIAKMNQWGSDGCDEHLDEICDHLRKAYKEQSWASVTTAGLAAFSTGIAWKLNPFNQLESLVRLAIARARENANTPAG